MEEAFQTEEDDFLKIERPSENIWVLLPHLNKNHPADQSAVRQQILLKKFFEDESVDKFIAWYYTPMAIYIGSGFTPEVTVYDCMDELSAFKFAPAGLKASEDELFAMADLVFTGGHSLYEAKKHRHSDIYPFPSSIDKEHFANARTISDDPGDQAQIPHPRIGFYGVIDERMNIDLIGKAASVRPDLHFVIIGPVVKIDPASLPQHDNIHFLGGKSYQELPSYLAGWDIAMIPFEINESTRFISPTKTPEYLSAGKPVISSSIQDVVNPYGINKLVHIADTHETFIEAASRELANTDRSEWLARVDAFLLDNSWNNTWNQMMELINDKIADKEAEKKIYNINLKEDLYV